MVLSVALVRDLYCTILAIQPKFTNENFLEILKIECGFRRNCLEITTMGNIPKNDKASSASPIVPKAC